MKHKVFGKKLNRDVKQRQALFKGLVQALVEHGKINTTLPKAKAVQGLIEKTVTEAKESTTASMRQVAAILNKKELITKLVSVIAPKFKDKQGGYVRILRIGKRSGDNAEAVIMEWSTDMTEKKEKQEVVKTAKKETKSLSAAKTKPTVKPKLKVKEK